MPGDAIKSADHNDILRQLRMLSSTSSAQGGMISGAGSFVASNVRKSLRDPSYVWVRNDTGADITSAEALFPILELGAVVNQPSESNEEVCFMPSFSGTTPDDDTVNFAVLQGPVKNGEWQRGVVLGTTWAKLYVNDENDTSADFTSGDNTALTSGSGSCTILWKESSGSPRWANVLIGGGGGGGEFAIVQPTGLCYGIGLACDCVTAYVWFASCGSSLKQGDIINVWDPQRCWFNVPTEILFGMLVYVSKYNNESPEEEYNPPKCVWFATGLCCVEGNEPA